MTIPDDQRKRIEAGLLDEERALWEMAKTGNWSTFMKLAVESKQNIVVSGATGSGKTSYLRSCVEFVPTYERLITVEDTPEMPLPNHPNHNRLLYRKSDTNGEQLE
ncbi:ATPase, T2SS/T4P/T4SS family, partial [Staphylococcus shinii]